MSAAAHHAVGALCEGPCGRTRMIAMIIVINGKELSLCPRCYADGAFVPKKETQEEREERTAAELKGKLAGRSLTQGDAMGPTEYYYTGELRERPPERSKAKAETASFDKDQNAPKAPAKPRGGRSRPKTL